MDGFRSSRAAGGARRRMGGPRRAELTARPPRPPRPLQPRLRGGGRGGPCRGIASARSAPRTSGRYSRACVAAGGAARATARRAPIRGGAPGRFSRIVLRRAGEPSRRFRAASPPRETQGRRPIGGVAHRASRTQRGACGDRRRAHDGAFRAAHVARAGAGLKPAPESPPRAASASLKGRRRAASDAFRAPSRRSPSRAPACRLAARGAAGA